MNIMEQIIKFLKDERGGGVVEYAIATAAVSAAAIAALTAFANDFNYKLENFIDDFLPMK